MAMFPPKQIYRKYLILNTKHFWIEKPVLNFNEPQKCLSKPSYESLIMRFEFYKQQNNVIEYNTIKTNQLKINDTPLINNRNRPTQKYKIQIQFILI